MCGSRSGLRGRSLKLSVSSIHIPGPLDSVTDCLKVYVESCGASREQAVDAVCNAFLAVLKEWVVPFAPSMTYSRQMPTSSGHVFQISE